MADKFGIEGGFVTTVHEFTHDETYTELRNAIGNNSEKSVEMMRTDSGVSDTLGKVIPELAGRVHDWFLHAPTPANSLVDITLLLKLETNVAEVNAALLHAAEHDLRGIVEFSVDPVDEDQVADNPHSAIFDCTLTAVSGRLVKLYAWYDNEWGYSNRVVDMVQRMVTADTPRKDQAATV
jgi:glyceraldehyde 3-phosphate dehydrogenase